MKLKSYQDACLNELKPFVGKTVTGLVRDRAGNFGLEFGDTDVWFLADPEGNGPGFPSVTKEQK